MELPEGRDPWNPKSTNGHTFRNEWASTEDETSIQPSTEGVGGTLQSSFRDISLGGINNIDDGFPSAASVVLEQSVWEDSRVHSESNPAVRRTSLVNDAGISNIGISSHEQPFEDAIPIPKGEPHQKIGEDLNDWLRTIKRTYKPLSMDIVVIEQLPDREGILFKHTNYLVKHLVHLPNTEASKDRSVIRRYSDFVWLQDVLLKRYPFRLIPELPPKKIGSQNADAVFLERRRKGLTRFINLIMKHPVLSQDELLLTFLTVPTDLSGWRKQANYDTSEEFTDKRITQAFMKMWQKELSEQWNEADASIEKSIELWVKITIVVERYERRIKQIAHERSILGLLIDDFSQVIPNLYPVEQNSNILDINNHFSIINKHLKKTMDHSSAESKESSENLVPKFRMFIDILLCLRGLFERYRLMAGNNVPQLQRRVEINTERLEAMKDKPDVSGAEYDKIRLIIQRDKKSINEELNRAWLIRECILEEFTIFQETQFMISRAFQEWSKLNSNYAGLNVNEWEGLTEILMEMPLSDT